MPFSLILDKQKQLQAMTFSMEDLEVHIQTIIQLQLAMDSPTAGRGNCFFAAIIQQLANRPELEIQNIYTVGSLRRMVCEFALGMEHPEVKKLAELHNRNASISFRAPWESFFANMKKNGGYNKVK